MGRVTTGLILAAVVASGGCHRESDDMPTASPEATPATRSWRAGEFPDGLRACDAVSAEIQRRLRVESSTGWGCSWRQGERDEDDHVGRWFYVNQQLYRPSQTLLWSSATEEARRGFQSLREWEKEHGRGLPVRGLGDEAKLAWEVMPGGWRREIFLAVRVRNVILEFTANEEFLVDQGRRRIQPFGEFEAEIVAAARDILARLGLPPGPGVPVPAYLSGEVRRARDICGLVGVLGDRLAPGIERHDISPVRSILGGGCHWSGNGGGRPELTVAVEVIPPSPLTGRTATQFATTIFKQWGGTFHRVPKLGDEAGIDRFSFESGLTRESRIFARRGNLLVEVSYGRGNHPSKEALDRAVIDIAGAVLAGYR